MVEKPFVSVVSAVYNVARYLPDFFSSLHAQTFDHSKIEIILVNDGSTDDSLELCEKFVAGWDGPARVLTQDNAGQSSARNCGLSEASGEWVNFADPDDWFGESIFSNMNHSVLKFANNKDQVNVFAGHTLMYQEAAGLVDDSHVLSYRFGGKPRVVNLSTKPNYLQTQVNSALYRREHLSSFELCFEPRLKMRFEDGLFNSLVLLSSEKPLLGIVSNAEYFYRVRNDGTSSVQKAKIDSDSYTLVPEFGHLQLLRAASAKEGRLIPTWVQNIVLYDIFWVLKDSQHNPLRATELNSGAVDRYIALLKEVLGQIDISAVYGFDLMFVKRWMREALVLFKHGNGSHSDFITVGQIDVSRQLMPLKIYYVGHAPDLRVSIGGAPAMPVSIGDQQFEILGTPIVWERTAWVSTKGIVRVFVDGVQLPLRDFLSLRDSSTYKFRASEVEALLEGAEAKDVPARFTHVKVATREVAKNSLLTWISTIRKSMSLTAIRLTCEAFLLRLPNIRKAYLDAWVFMDRDTDANDSAEVMYKWVSENRPAVKSYFVLRRSAPEWQRLRREGVRLVAYGTLRWRLMLLLSSNLISSHANVYVTNPLPKSDYGMPQWNFTFLQHGVIKGDISGWLNTKNISTFVASTEQEYQYIIGPGPYKFSAKEVRLTGLPRHDMLLSKDAKVNSDQRNLILIAPTWRNYLMGAPDRHTNAREHNSDFMSSNYAKHFTELLWSDELKKLVQLHGKQLAFMPHPNIQPYLSEFKIPTWVRTIHYDSVDVQDIMCRSSVLVTDYSSMAFNMAYLRRPVVYDQFDRSEFYAGGHTERPGYFSYDRDGFGPVASTIDQVVDGVEASLAGVLDQKYFERMKSTFPVRDGRNCARVYKAIVAASKPPRKQDRLKPAKLDRWRVEANKKAEVISSN